MARNNSQSKGVSLAKGPVGIIGLVGIVYGISALIFGGHGFALHIPHGAVHGKKWLGLEVNGWSDLLFIAAGLLLLFAAPLHWGAKSMSLLVALVLGAAAVVAVIRGDGVFGILAANHFTELIWGAAAVLLFLLAWLPRLGGKRGTADEREPAPTPRRTRVVERQPVTEAQTEPVREPVRAAGARRTHTEIHESQKETQ